MEPLISRVHTHLTRDRKTIAVAESCTAGLLASLLTAQSGSSSYFLAGIITYSNHAKETLLGISTRLIRDQGAVSKGVALKMASQVRTIAGSDIGIGITGIAGPTGGSPKKPVGTVYIAISTPRKEICRKYRLKGNRQAIRRKAALFSLMLLEKTL